MRFADRELFERRSVLWFLRLYGAALIVNVITELLAGVWRVHTGELYPWRHIPLLPLYPTWVLFIEWSVTAAAGLALALSTRIGVAARVAAAVTFVALLERYSNHGALLFLIALFLAIDPPDPNAPHFEQTPQPALGLIRAQLVIVYAFSALNKLSHGFTSDASLMNLLEWPERYARAASWGIVGGEIALPIVLLLSPRVGVVALVALHGVFSFWIPGLGSFGLAMIAMAVLFMTPRRPAAELGNRRVALMEM